MRHLSSASLAAAIALSFATTAGAATTAAAKSVAGNMSATGTIITSAPKIEAGQPVAASSSSGTGTGTSATTTPPTNTTTVDVRNQQTLDAVAANHASGSTSSLGPLAGAPNVSGTTTGTGTTVGTTVGTTGALPFAVAPFGTPDVTSSAAVASTTTPTLASNGVFASDVYGTPVLSANVVATEQVTNDATVNRAIRQVTRDRARIGRNGQLLYSIAPRTNVDRRNEMPDDGPSASLSGYNSALVR